MVVRAVATVFAVVGLTAFSAAAQALKGDEKELATYRLTMPTVKKVAAVTRAFAEIEKQDPLEQEKTKVEAELEKLEAKEELTDADRARMEKLAERAEQLEAEIDDRDEKAGPDDSLDDIEARIRKEPRAMALLAKEGLTPREYAKCMFALVQVAIVEGFSQGKADLAKLPAGINPENVKFYREHKAELDRLTKALSGPDKD